MLETGAITSTSQMLILTTQMLISASMLALNNITENSPTTESAYYTETKQHTGETPEANSMTNNIHPSIGNSVYYFLQIEGVITWQSSA